MRLTWFLAAFGLSGLVSFGAGVAHAGDGATEISHAGALAGKAGDPAGFPVSINTPGRYLLTSNLDLSVAADPANTDAIQITADNVTVDLNGFRIVGPADCSELPAIPCTGTGSGVGIHAISQLGTVVKNGTIRGMGDHGVGLEDSHGSTIQDVRALSNGGIGIFADGSARVTECLALQNGGSGILAGRGEVSENIASLNGLYGIEGAAVVSRNVMATNGNAGLRDGTAYSENFFYFNNSGGAQVDSSAPETGPNACAFDALCE